MLVATALLLVPGLANAGGGGVPMAEPSVFSLLGAGLLALACMFGVVTVSRVIGERRSRITSTHQL